MSQQSESGDDVHAENRGQPASPSPSNHGAVMEEFSYDDAIVRMFMVATLVWGFVAMLVGIYIALMLVMPEASLRLEFLTFGRLRPLHTNAAIFAFAGNGIFAAVYYSTQRLCKARMWSDLLSRLHFWGWQAIIVSAALTLPFGVTQSKEYAELEWPIDIAIAIVWLVIFGGNFLMTLVKRRERHMYVALWFYIATIVTVAMLHVFNNLVVPSGLLKSYPIYAGVQDAFMQWWYGHNAVAFFLTTPFLGLMYYFLPKAAGRPVFSYRLSIIHFWSLVFIYIWAGPHHLHYTAIPGWASTLGMVFSLMLWMPSWGGMINGLMTLRGAWHKVASDPILKFFVVGITFYGMSTFEGPMLSIKSVNALSHYTDWTIAHVHGGALGWNGFMTFGMLYWLMPRVFQTEGVWSQKLVSTHFWIGTLGILAYIVPIYVAGITQGLMWQDFNEDGSLKYTFIQTVQQLMPMYAIRVLAGVLYLTGVVLMGINMFMTWKNRPAQYKVEVHRAPALGRHYVDPPLRESHMEGVLDLGNKVDTFAKGYWHRRWEHLPIRFTIYVTIAVVIATLLELIPTFLIRSNVPTIDTVKPYTPLELVGRDIYVAEGCYNCHSQMIRPLLQDTERYGEFSKPGEFIYDHPFQWGSRRIGPDLAREGGRQNHLWHLLHFRAPSEYVEGSIMPPYPWLEEKKLNFGTVKDRVNAAIILGADYEAAYGISNDSEAESHAVKQAEEIAAEIVKQAGEETTLKTDQLKKTFVVALIAYVQRLGTDISATPESTAPPVADSEAAEEDASNNDLTNEGN